MVLHSVKPPNPLLITVNISMYFSLFTHCHFKKCIYICTIPINKY